MAKHKGGHQKNRRRIRNSKGKKPNAGDKIHGTKKGKKGEVAAYTTRATALKRLQVSLADFRRLCILKGIYPRDPKKKAKGNDKTYYHSKDIIFLSHEPLLNKFLELKTFMKKFKRLMGRKERGLALGLADRKPVYTLHHLIRERYPSFDDAVRDMDDAVSMLALIQSLPADQKRDIPADVVTEANVLYQEFQLYVIRAQALRKVFASIKGYYFQVEVLGQTVTWLAPHQFTQELPGEVDFRVMLTFTEFYRCLLKFVNFKLYAGRGLVYPPKRDLKKEEGSAEIAALEAEAAAGEAANLSEEQASKEAEDAVASITAEFGDESEEAQKMRDQMAEATRKRTIFKGMQVFIGREVPLRPIYFTLLCGGAKVGWEREGSPFGADHASVTHQICDRPAASLEIRAGREYVQPQWVLDSFNTGCVLPVAPYAPGKAPPPHLSPFVNDKEEGYIPRQRELLNALVEEVAPPKSAEGDGKTALDGSAKGGFEQFNEELQAEKQGVWFSDFKKEKEAKAADLMEKGADVPTRTKAEDEAHEAAKAMMPKKHKRLLQRIEKGNQQKQDMAEKLMRKRKLHEKAQASKP